MSASTKNPTDFSRWSVKKTITFLAMFMFTIMLATLSVATTYYDQNFNSNVCNNLTFARADIGGSAPSWDYTCSVSSGVLHLYTKNTLITGFNLTAPLLNQDFWNRNLTYTIILKKGHQYSDFYFFPFIMDKNLRENVNNGNPRTITAQNFNFSSAITFAGTYHELQTPSTSFTLNNKMVFTLPIKIDYPSKSITVTGSTSISYNFVSQQWSNYGLYTTITNQSNACVDDGCVIQILWGGIDNKILTYYINNNKVAQYQFTKTLESYGGSNSADYQDSLNNTFSGAVFFSGNDYVDVDIDRIKLEEGNTVGQYFWGSSTATPVDCNDGLDNDFDGLIDYPEDPSCMNATDTSESPKDASLCEEDTCSQADKCVFFTDFNCNDELNLHGWTSYPESIASLQKSDGMKILLNKYLHHPTHICPVLPNGSIECSLPVILNLYHNYSTNKLDYSQVEHKFLFYFINNFYQYSLNASGTVNESVTVAFYGNNGGIIGGVQLKVTSLNSSPYDVNIEVLNWDDTSIANTTTDLSAFYKFELIVKTYKPSTLNPNPYYEYFYRSPTSTDILLSSWKYSNDRFNFSTSNDTYVKSLVLGITGDSDYTDYWNPIPISENSMYLSSIDVKGIFDENETTTQCTEWSSPYILKEDFNGCLNNCGWNTVPSSLCTYGSLQSTLTDSIAIAKQNDYVDSTISRYVTLSFDITPTDFDLINGVSFQLYDADATNFIYLIINSGVLFNRVDGNYNVISALNQNVLNNIKIHIDLSEDTFDVYLDGYLISSGNHFTNSITDVTSIGSFYLQSSYYAYLLDNVKMYMTDQSNNELIINPNEEPPTVVDATKGVCGHVFKITPACEQDSECETGYCTPTGTCSSFDWTYCDENGMTRGNQCVLSAYGGCFMSSIGTIILGNFVYVLIFILFLVGVTYLAVMLRSRGK